MDQCLRVLRRRSSIGAIEGKTDRSRVAGEVVSLPGVRRLESFHERSNRRARFLTDVRPVHIRVQDLNELRDDVVSTQGHFEFAVYVDRSNRLLKRAGKRNADVRMLRLARTV